MTNPIRRRGRPRKLKVIEVKTIDRTKYPQCRENGNRFARMDDAARIAELVELGGRLWAETCEDLVREKKRAAAA
jgi:hypothetical protein